VVALADAAVGIPLCAQSAVCACICRDLWAVSSFGMCCWECASHRVIGSGPAGPRGAFFLERGSDGLSLAEVGSSEDFITFLNQETLIDDQPLDQSRAMELEAMMELVSSPAVRCVAGAAKKLCPCVLFCITENRTALVAPCSLQGTAQPP